MTNILPFPHRPDDQAVSVDVDGDGVPDRITPGPGTTLERAPDRGLAPALPTVTVHRHELRPVVPGWLRTRAGRRAMARRFLIIWWHKVLFHSVRLPMYGPLLLWRAARGAGAAVLFLLRWALDLRADPMEQLLATGSRSDAEAFRKHREARSVRIKARLVVLCTALVCCAIGAVLAQRYLPQAAQLALLTAAGMGLAKAGTPAGRTLLAPAMVASSAYRELTDVIVMRALRVAGLGGQAPRLDRDGTPVSEDTRPTLAAPIARSATGQAYEVLVDLPFGKTAEDAAAAVDRLASGLDVEAAQVFVEPVPGSTRRCRIIVADEDPMTLPPHRSPLASLPRASVWDPHPIALTPTGRAVAATLLFNAFLIGAVPRSGKSYAGKVLVAQGVLDPHCDLTVLDCGGGRDWLAVHQVAVNYISGDDDDDLRRIVAILEQLRSDCRDRLARFQELATVDIPEDRLTRELAAAGMHPHLIIVDEIQNLLRAPDKAVRTAALDVLVWLAKTAPKAGFVLVAITQRPAAEVVPADLRDVISVRIALRTKTRQGSDAILGSDISATGYRSDRFREDQKGACVIGGISLGTGGDLQYARTDLLTPAQFERACLVGRQRRIDAGTLHGAAVGEAPEVTITVSVVEDVASVWPGKESRVQAHALLERLQQVYGDRYTGWDETTLTRALKGHGVPVRQVFRGGSNRNGYALTDVTKARRALEAD